MTTRSLAHSSILVLVLAASLLSAGSRYVLARTSDSHSKDWPRTVLVTNDDGIDHQGFDPQGQVRDYEMVLEAYRPGGVKLEAYEVEDLEKRIVGDVGIITGKGRIQGTYAEHEFAHHVRFLDLYVQKNGRWRLYLSQVTPLGVV